MIRPNWDIFKAKFSNNKQSNFEWLCYLLFCREFNKPKGIMRYKNQAGIETEPITVEGRKIGWQAKFCETRLSENKKSFKDSIDKTKEKHPDIDKIIFYTNQEFGEGRDGSSPNYKKSIEAHAKNKGIDIDWKTASFFELGFVCIENEKIAYHFFSFEKSIFDFIHELSSHTKSLLSQIQSEINFQGNKIKIDRSDIIKQLKDVLISSPSAILTGEAGSGKTAIIKDWHNEIKKKCSMAFFMFKASEFNISHINKLFENYGNFKLIDFVKEHKNHSKKFVVIDSAEQLSNIENDEPFKEFLSVLVQNSWKIVFTIRHNYCDDLKYHLSIYCNTTSSRLKVPNITTDNLEKFSMKNSFDLPTNQKLLELLRSPFFLREYLKNYSEMKDNIDYLSFKEIVWNNVALKASSQNKMQLEQYFLELAKKKADEGLFTTTIDGFSDEFPKALQANEIIKYDSQLGGYFVVHDIYEEWALDKIIDRSFCNRSDYKEFFDKIGSSLSIRRAFRDWLSAKLETNSKDAKQLVESCIQSRDIEKHWRDEILVSVLFSDYCSNFFEIFDPQLLKEYKQIVSSKFQACIKSHYNKGLLYKLLFLIRIACKEPDDSILEILGLPKTSKNRNMFEHTFLKPKGKGWNCVIGFLNKHKESFELPGINIILPIIEDWNYKNKKGETTRNASLLALFYYEKIMNTQDNFQYDEIKKRLVKVIFEGSYEIKKELDCVFKSIISKKETSRNSRYYQLAHAILTSPLENMEMIKNLPEQVIQLADLFWFRVPENNRSTRVSNKINGYFSVISSYDFRYEPASSLQTPILPLLHTVFELAIDFILSFVNRTIDSFSKSKLSDGLEEIEVFINENESVKQYISSRVWGIYRGNQGFPHLLESIHMALEKYFLDNGKKMIDSELEEHLLSLLKRSKSASISAVVTSIVLAYPEKTFNVAKVLFQTKEFFIYSNILSTTDRVTTEVNDVLNTNFGITDDFEYERAQSDKLKHRRQNLENLAVQYQFALFKGENEQKLEERKRILFDIFDEYHEQLSNPPDGVVQDKDWKLILSRIDRRKMNPQIKEENGQSVLYLNTKIDPDLKKYRDNKLKEIENIDGNKYVGLFLWSKSKFEEKKLEYEQYPQYESNLKLVIMETKQVNKELEDVIAISKSNNDWLFPAYNMTQVLTPLYSCAVLVRDYFDLLNSEDKEFCLNVFMKCFYRILNDQSQSRKVEEDIATIMLHILLKRFPNNKQQIKTIVLKLLFQIKYSQSNSILKSISYMWKENFKDAYSVFIGYLLLKPKFDNFINGTGLLSRSNVKHKYQKGHELEGFFEEHKGKINDMVENKLTYKMILDEYDMAKLSLETLVTAFEILQFETKNKEHKEFIKTILPICLEKIKSSTSGTSGLKHKFLIKLASCILTSKNDDMKLYLSYFVEQPDNLISDQIINTFLEILTIVANKFNKHENFWTVWSIFYPKIVEICNKRPSHLDKKIIRNYLLAEKDLGQGVKQWHALKESEKLFFKQVSKDVGHHPTVLYSISRVLNGIGSNFRDDGILWISDIIKNNSDLPNEGLEIDTTFYIENIVKAYVFDNRQTIKRDHRIKKQILIILNFLIETGSAVAYRLRENIL